jgi:flavin-dependent thymidylate synthase
MIINGSVRGYKHFLNHVTENDYENNIIIRYMINLLTEYSVKELYGTNFFLHEGYKEEVLNFVDADPYVLDIETPRNGIQYDTIVNRVIEGIATNSEPDCKQITLGVDADPLAVSNEFDIIEELLQAGFYANVAYNIIPVAVVFRNMSRTATHQLVRHRNAITQESQRYVPAENATFTIPVPEYTDEKEYTVDIFGKKTTVPLTVLATQLTKIYEQLRKQGLKKEEARAFLPANINCGRLYMTFTLNSMRAFLNLRTDPHAQYEIRRYAETIKEALEEINLIIN